MTRLQSEATSPSPSIQSDVSDLKALQSKIEEELEEIEGRGGRGGKGGDDDDDDDDEESHKDVVRTLKHKIHSKCQDFKQTMIKQISASATKVVYKADHGTNFIPPIKHDEVLVQCSALKGPVRA